MSAIKMQARKLRIVFVECESPENAGFLARTMKNFGFNDLWLVNPTAQIKTLGARTAMHAREILNRAKIVSTLEESLTRADTVVGTTSTRPFSDSNVLRNFITPKEFGGQWAKSAGLTALVFGREGIGLTNREINRCDFIVSIPTSKAYPAMNISHSAAVILYELAVYSSFIRPTRRAASKADKERVVQMVNKCLNKTLFPEHRTLRASRVLQNILGRSYVTKREATILLGIFRRFYSNLPQKRKNEG
jgi:tRNA/rRNA methyltransferase